MVPNKVFILIGVAVALTACLVDCGSLGIRTEKCKPNKKAIEEYFPEIMECCEQLIDKQCNKDTIIEDAPEFSADEQDIMCKCMAEKQGIITVDGKFDVAKSKESINLLEVDDATRIALEKSVDECNKNNAEDTEAIRKCCHKATEAICEG